MYEPKYIHHWKCPAFYAGAAWDDYFVSGFGRNRNSGVIEESNFSAALKALGGESETVKVIHERHFLVGWIEWIAIHETDAKAIEIADDLYHRRDDYPILDEDDVSQRESEAASELWRLNYDPQERIDYIRENRSQFSFTSLKEMLKCVRGEYFAGYPDEFLG